MTDHAGDRHALYGVHRHTRDAYCTCGVALPEALIDEHIESGNRADRAHTAAVAHTPVASPGT